MKVALVHKRFDLRGGTERYLVGLARGLAQRGHQVSVYTASADPVQAVGRSISWNRLWRLRGGPLVSALSLFLSARRAVLPGSHDVVLALGRTLPADVYRAGGGCHAVYHQELLGRARGWRKLLLQLSLHHRFLLWVESRQLAETGAKRIVAVSHLARNELASRHPGAVPRLRVVWNGVDLERFHPRNRDLFFSEVRRELGIEPHETVVLFVGNGWERKGLSQAIRAVHALADPDLRLVVVGKDPGGTAWQAEARSLGLSSHVLFTGEVARVERYLGTADVFLLPTRYDPFANSCLEALACGVPVVTTARNGASEVLIGCPAARVVEDPEDVPALANALAELLRHPDRRILYGEARKRALEHGEWKAVEGMIAVLDEVVQGRERE